MSKRKTTRDLPQASLSKRPKEGQGDELQKILDEKMKTSYCDFLNFLRTEFTCLLYPLYSLVSEYYVGYCPNRKYNNHTCLCMERSEFIDKPVYITNYEINSKFFSLNPTRVIIQNKTTNVFVECDIIRIWRCLNDIDFTCVTYLEVTGDDFGAGFDAERLKNAHLNNFFVYEFTFQQIEKAEKKRQEKIDEDSRDLMYDFQGDTKCIRLEPQLSITDSLCFHVVINKKLSELQSNLGYIDEYNCTLKFDVDTKILSWSMEIYNDNEAEILFIEFDYFSKKNNNNI